MSSERKRANRALDSEPALVASNKKQKIVKEEKNDLKKEDTGNKKQKIKEEKEVVVKVKNEKKKAVVKSEREDEPLKKGAKSPKSNTPKAQNGDEQNCVARIYLECAANATFYDISVVDKTLITKWGKIDTPGTKLEMPLCSPLACMNQLEEKVKEKKRKGYITAVPPAPLDRGEPTYEVKLIYIDTPQNSYYDKHYTVTQFGSEVFIRDGMKGERATTSYKTLKNEVAARKLLDKNVTERLAAGYLFLPK